MNKNYYEILGIEHSASQTEIKKAYKKLAQKFHPDKNDGDSFFEKMFKNIQEAYECLINPDCRRKYDQKIDSFSKKDDSTPKEKSTPAYNERKNTEDTKPREKSNSSNTWLIAFGIIFLIFIAFIAFPNNFLLNTKDTTVKYPLENEFNSITTKKQPISEKENLSRVIDSMKYIQEDQIRKANRKIDSIKRIQAEQQEQIASQERMPESKADVEKSEVISFLEEYYKFYKRDEVFRRPMVKKIDQYNYEVSIEESNRRFEDSDFHYRAKIVYVSREDNGSLKYGKRYHSDMFNGTR